MSRAWAGLARTGNELCYLLHLGFFASFFGGVGIFTILFWRGMARSRGMGRVEGQTGKLNATFLCCEVELLFPWGAW